MHFVAALDRKPRMRCILGLFEGVVTGAADGFGRMARRPAATLLHTGPGLANGLANLHNAKRASTPIINIVDDHASHHLKFNAPLTSDVNALAQPMSDRVRRVDRAEAMGDVIVDAYHAAMETPGVATVILPADSAWGDAVSGTAAMAELGDRAVPDATTVQEVAAAIRAHRDRFAIVVGGDAALEMGTELAGRIAGSFGGVVLAEVLPARVARGQGRVSPDSIPYPVDHAVACLKDFALIVLVGAPEPVAFFGYPGKPSRLVSKDCMVATLATRADDQLAALHALIDELGPLSTRPSPNRRPFETVQGSGPLTPESLCRVLAQKLPEDAILCDEGLAATFPFRAVWDHARTHDYLSVTGGSIGIGIPLSVGAAVACPGRRVVDLQADGRRHVHRTGALDPGTREPQRLDSHSVEPRLRNP